MYFMGRSYITNICLYRQADRCGCGIMLLYFSNPTKINIIGYAKPVILKLRNMVNFLTMMELNRSTTIRPVAMLICFSHGIFYIICVIDFITL